MSHAWKMVMGEDDDARKRDEKRERVNQGPPPARELAMRDAARTAQGAPDFATWLASLPRYTGEPMSLEEWVDPSRWSSPEAAHEAEEAAEMFHAGYLEEAENEVYEAMALMHAAASAREGGTTVSTKNAGVKNPNLWKQITGQGVPVEMDMGVDDVGGQEDLDEMLGGESAEGSDEVTLSADDLEHVRSGLDKIHADEEDEKKKKKIAETIDKFAADADSAVVKFVVDEEGADEGEAAAGAGEAEGGGADDDGLGDFLNGM